MDEKTRISFVENIKLYNKACKKEPPLDLKDKNDINAYFYIITCMREVYGCPSCGAKSKCKCKLIESISPHIRFKDGEKGCPRILW